MELGEQEEADLSAACWHANLIRIDRRKCLLFTHDTTLFSLFVPGVTRPDFKHFTDLLGQALFKTMLYFDFTQAQIEHMLDASREIGVAKTNNRSVLGSMNDMKYMIEVAVYNSGGLKTTDMDEVRQLINHTIYKAIGYACPKEKMRGLLGAIKS